MAQDPDHINRTSVDIATLDGDDCLRADIIEINAETHVEFRVLRRVAATGEAAPDPDNGLILHRRWLPKLGILLDQVEETLEQGDERRSSHHPSPEKG